MEQFSLEKWLKDKSRKVVTRDGRPARIVCWDLPGENKIIGITDESDDGYTVINKKTDGTGGVSNNDLFFADEEEELTEFEKAVQSICKNLRDGIDDIGDIHVLSNNLLDLARKELLKDLPKWKKSDRNWITNICDLATIVRCDGGDHEDYDSVVVSNRVDKDDYYIELGELLKLPKEE